MAFRLLAGLVDLILDPAVLGFAFRRRVVGDRLRGTVADYLDATGLDTEVVCFFSSSPAPFSFPLYSSSISAEFGLNICAPFRYLPTAS
jgi:hypothetical protein